MNKDCNIVVRTDAKLKRQAENLFREMGMNMSMAINIFFKQSVREQALPFYVSKKVNKESYE